MTFEECQSRLATLRAKQGTKFPLVRVDYGGYTYQGRLSRADIDPEQAHRADSPFGVLVLEDPGLGRGPATYLQIANIANDGIREFEQN